MEATTPLDDPAALTNLAMLHLRIAEVMTSMEMSDRMGQAVRDSKSSASTMIEMLGKELDRGEHGFGEDLS